ncbi:MAG: fibronectin type III domain-containing protein [Steroidobacteraceae bacterium]
MVLGLGACSNESTQSPAAAASGQTGNASLADSSAPLVEASGNITLSWVAPDSNTDGSYLTNLAGYRIIYGTDATNLNQSIVIDNPSISIYVVDNLTPGTWYFAVVSVNHGGAESDLSPVVSARIS